MSTIFSSIRLAEPVSCFLLANSFPSLAGVFPETQEAADATVYAHRADQRPLGANVNVYAAWTLSEIVLAGEARLGAVEGHMRRLFDDSLAMARSLWPSAVAPNSVTRLARWLEAGVDRLGMWRASAARVDAETALQFVASWYPGVDLDRLAAQRAGVEE